MSIGSLVPAVAAHTILIIRYACFRRVKLIQTKRKYSVISHLNCMHGDICERCIAAGPQTNERTFVDKKKKRVSPQI